jgi:methionyl-tRNA formyltransferase
MACRWRIIFFGTPSFAIPTLESLLQGPDEVVGVVTQPDREKGRGRKIVDSPIKKLALQQGLALFQPEKAKEIAFQENISALQPDLFVVVAYGQILTKSFLEIPKQGAVNVHASLLPKYRGAAPIVRAILRGEQVTGVTTMMMDEGMDTGDILLQAEVAIGEEETSETLRDRLSLLGAPLLLETVEHMKKGSIRPLSQEHFKASYAPPLKKEEGLIDWKKDARDIDLQVRAFNPWPVAFTHLEGQLLKIYKGEARKGKSGLKPGTVIWVSSDSIEVETGQGSFVIKEVQLEGRKRMATREFLSGRPVTLSAVFK